MRPAAEHHDRCATQPANQQLAGVTTDADRREAWDFGIRDLSVDVEFAQDMVKTAAQDDAQRWPQPGQFLQARGGGFRMNLRFAHAAGLPSLVHCLIIWLD